MLAVVAPKGCSISLWTGYGETLQCPFQENFISIKPKMVYSGAFL